jgi:hypothetical protein
MAGRQEELRRAASNSILRGAYQVAIEALDAMVYRLGMLRALAVPARHQVPGSITSPVHAPKTVTRWRRSRPDPCGTQSATVMPVGAEHPPGQASDASERRSVPAETVPAMWNAILGA